MLKMDDRFNIEKHTFDKGNIKIFIYNYEVNKETDNAKMYVRNLEGSLIKTYDPIWIDKDAIFFTIDDTLEAGKYMYDVVLTSNYESVDILHDRGLKVC